MECAEYDRLEYELIEIREQRDRMLFRGDLTDEIVREITEAERPAIIRLTDHRSEHRCKNAGE